jgi:hypothetical protein
MSAMGELAVELELYWIEVEPGRCYLHVSALWDILPAEGITVSLWHAGDHVLTGELHTAVHHVAQREYWQQFVVDCDEYDAIMGTNR